jgi:glyoxylase-like metal-dependent hydrolase (beta-lactamase superfamily II)
MGPSGWQIGDIWITPIVEMDASGAIQEIIADARPADIARAPWLTRDHLDDSGHLNGVIQCLLIEVEDTFILVDTCVGNGKQRQGPTWNDLHTDFLDRLCRVLPSPDDVSRVVSTHLHFDHVGWNTHAVDGVWEPTFVNARYLVSDGEFRYWQSRSASAAGDHRAGFDDSIVPVAEAGLLHLVGDDAVVTDGIRLVPSPGHTPHHVSVLLESRGHSALITGDAIHHPCQIAYPDWSTISDFDQHQARVSRKALLDRCAGSGTLLIGSHFAAPAIGRVRKNSAGYALEG